MPSPHDTLTAEDKLFIETVFKMFSLVKIALNKDPALEFVGFDSVKRMLDAWNASEDKSKPTRDDLQRIANAATSEAVS